MHRIDALDGVRAIAAIVVVAFHCWIPGFNGGFFGVDVFFVLSGYLITGLLIADIDRTGTVSLGNFYRRRAIRLMPALALMLAGFAFAGPLLFPNTPILPELALPALYVSNISRAFFGAPAVTAHTWSLATEMQFYLLWPLAILALSRLPRRRMLAVLMTLFAAATLWRWLQCVGGDWSRVYFAPDTHLSGLMLGSVISVMPWRPSEAVQKLAAPAALVVLLTMLLLSTYGSLDALFLGTTIVELAAALLIVALHSEVPRGAIATALASAPMVRLGAWSYGIYLWHYPIARWTRDHYEPWLALAITLPLSVALAAFSYQLVERPFSRWMAGRTGFNSASHPQRHPVP